MDEEATRKVGRESRDQRERERRHGEAPRLLALVCAVDHHHGVDVRPQPLATREHVSVKELQLLAHPQVARDERNIPEVAEHLARGGVDHAHGERIVIASLHADRVDEARELLAPLQEGLTGMARALELLGRIEARAQLRQSLRRDLDQLVVLGVTHLPRGVAGDAEDHDARGAREPDRRSFGDRPVAASCRLHRSSRGGTIR